VPAQQPPAAQLIARKLVLSGQVQGVGFRPFIYRLANEFNLAGWVKNCIGVVEVQVQGEAACVDDFRRAIFDNKPSLADPVLDTDIEVDVTAIQSFRILPSAQQASTSISVPADLFLCDDCLAELNDASDRRYRYPFINCTQCGPRYSLIRSLPYDRANTTMAGFTLCRQCSAEYNDPSNRRFHAEPVACPDCGPVLDFRQQAVSITDNEFALAAAVEVLRQGRILAVKGIGGYHLMCDAGNDAAVARLRQRKVRPHKPLAVMFPSPIDDPFYYAQQSLQLSDDDRKRLLQASRPILLVPRSAQSKLSAHIAPGLKEVGALLPYSPLHHLLLNDFAAALVATSANISGEPVLIDNRQVEQRLSHIADAFLHHDRDIERPVDDPVYRRVAGMPRPIRIGRGSAPLELTLPFELQQPVLAVGAQMKNTIALGWKNRVLVSPHIGELTSTYGAKVFENTINDLQRLYNVKAELIICDAHPGYSSSRWAQQQGLPLHRVYHHHAHACAAYHECETEDDVLVFSWDGVGYGEDGSLWGGETFFGRPGRWQRVASLRPFRLPGGDKAGREPWRSAAALCWQSGRRYEACGQQDDLLWQAWHKNINSPQTSSMGRLFDAAAALTGVCTHASFEGQAPMLLEARCHKLNHHIELPLTQTAELLLTDWEPLVPMLLDDKQAVAQRAALFHASLAHAMLQQATIMREKFAVNTISLCGGVFQNRVLTDYAIELLTQDGFELKLPKLIPLNDAGISFGQIIDHACTTDTEAH
jgi:hydrogenase maturation protein HypF